jgi:hypothetical protein
MSESINRSNNIELCHEAALAMDSAMSERRKWIDMAMGIQANAHDDVQRPVDYEFERAYQCYELAQQIGDAILSKEL